jgi:hypothetical protein
VSNDGNEAECFYYQSREEKIENLCSGCLPYPS